MTVNLYTQFAKDTIDEQKDSHLFNVPIDPLVQNILMRLTLPDISNAMLSCKKLYHICRTSNLWQEPLKQYLSSSDTLPPVSEAYQTLRDTYQIHENIKNNRYELRELTHEGNKYNGRNIAIYNDRLVEVDRKKCHIWNIDTATYIDSIKHEKSIEAIAIDEGMLFSGSFDHTCKMWNLETRELIRSFEGHKDAVNEIRVYKDKLLTVCRDKTCRIWDIKTGNCLAILEGHPNSIDHIEIAEDTIVASSQTNDGKSFTIIGWDLSGKCLYTIKDQGSISGIKIRQGRFFVSRSTWLCFCQMIDLKTGIVLKSIYNQPNHGSSCLELFEDKVVIASGTIYIWDPERNTLKSSDGPKDLISSMKIFHRKVFAGCDGICGIWDLDTLTCLNTFTDHIEEDYFYHVLCVAYVNGKLISKTASTPILIRDFKLDTQPRSNTKQDLRTFLQALSTALKTSDFPTASSLFDLKLLINQFRKLPMEQKKTIYTFCCTELKKAFNKPENLSIEEEVDKHFFDINSVFCHEKRELEVDKSFARGLDLFLQTQQTNLIIDLD